MTVEYAIQNLNTKSYLNLARGMKWSIHPNGAVCFRLPETARAVARSLVSRYHVSWATGRATRFDDGSLRLAVVPLKMLSK